MAVSRVDELGRLVGRLKSSGRAFCPPAAPFTRAGVYEDLGLHLDHVPAVTLGEARVYGRGAYERVPLRFVSRTSLGDQTVDTVVGELYLLRGRPPAPVTVLIHGNGAPGPGYERLRARDLLRAGHHAASIAVAGHLGRRSQGLVNPGLVGADLQMSVSTVVASTGDTGDLVRWLRLQPFATEVGVAGWSLGGLVSMLTATVVEVDHCVPVVPAVDVPWSLYSSRYIPEEIRDLVGARYANVDRVRSAMAAIRPIERRPLRASGVHVVGGSRDELCGTENVEAVSKAWGATLTWVDKGHVGGALSGGKQAMRLVAGELAWP